MVEFFIISENKKPYLFLGIYMCKEITNSYGDTAEFRGDSLNIFYILPFYANRKDHRDNPILKVVKKSSKFDFHSISNGGEFCIEKKPLIAKYQMIPPYYHLDGADKFLAHLRKRFSDLGLNENDLEYLSGNISLKLKL